MFVLLANALQFFLVELLPASNDFTACDIWQDFLLLALWLEISWRV